MGFHPNDKRSQVIRPKTHTTFFIFLLDKVKYWFYTVCSWKWNDPQNKEDLCKYQLFPTIQLNYINNLLLTQQKSSMS